MEEEYLAMCGLDCARCAAYIATKNNDNELREKTAKEWTARYVAGNLNRPPLKPEDINCSGCLSDGPVYQHCLKCEVRKCGLEKGIKNCRECKDYKCGPLAELQKRFFES